MLRFCTWLVVLLLSASILAPKATAKPVSGIATQRYALGRWQLQIRTDRFSGDVRCRLRSRNDKMLYAAGAVGLHVGGHSEILETWFRVDGGEPLRWRDALPELARLRVPMAGRDMDRPTDGLIWLPADMLESAHKIAVMRRPGRRPKTFRLAGFAELREAAVRLGCMPDRRFVP